MSDIANLMAADPLGLSDQDIDKIVAYYQENSAKFLAEKATPKEPKASKTPKAAKTQVSFSDLFDEEL